MPNIHDPHFDQLREHPGFRARRAYVGRQAGARRLGLSLWEVDPGHAAYPYHWHFAEEELIVVIAGRPTLRTPTGRRTLEEGEVISFPVGEEGAHQLVNETDEPVRFLAMSTSGEPEICVYPDSGKLGVYGREAGGEEFRALFRHADAVDYWDGETRPE